MKVNSMWLVATAITAVFFGCEGMDDDQIAELLELKPMEGEARDNGGTSGDVSESLQNDPLDRPAHLTGGVEPSWKESVDIEENPNNFDELPDEELIDNSDILLVNATKPSWGTAMEIMYAFQKNKPVISVVGERISPWTRYHSTHLETTLDAAIERINSADIHG